MDEIKNYTDSAKLLYVEQSEKTDQWHSILHSHPFTELFYVVRGSGSMKFSNVESITIQEDDLIIVNPNIFHTETCEANESLEYIVIGLEGIIFETDEQNPRYSIQNFTEYKHDVLLYLRGLIEEFKHKDPYYENIADNLLKILLMNILRRSNSKLELASMSSSANKDCLFIESYILENSHLEITLDHLSEITFLDKFYLSHLFKEYSGMAPIEYLLHVRIEKAIKLLTTTDFSVSYISSMLGFKNAAYFSQFFKKKKNMSPSKYRNLYHIERKVNESHS